ncbi:alpha/beta fold hydrolase [Haloplanus pelagicus]|jgi:pimeloyl-ACP methyl ester carboxylesterase|uniref:alpha/beta fold hydrolase n=1 Tax=Haloplanus pelagicus TaxID=2949995 RepID=UPI00203AECC0|nr:alpha/beta hydrolase [Haloplanus sp. HW8-1]
MVPDADGALRTVSTAADRRVSYAEYGDPDGTPVLFLHGTPGSHVLGGLFDPEATRAGVRLLAPDRPGYGRSTPWPTRTLADTAAFVTPVLDDAGVDVAGVVGFSGGGPHALALAATRPARIERVDVVAGAPPPSLDHRPPTAQRLLATLATVAPPLLRGLFGVQAWVADRLPPRTVVAQYTTTTDPADLPDDVVERVRRDFVAAFAHHRHGAVTEFDLLDRAWDVSPSRIDVPVHLWHGDRDANAPLAGARHLRERVPTADLTVLDGADHLSTLLRSRTPVLDGQRAAPTGGE